MLLACKGRRKQFISRDAIEIAKCRRQKTIATEELKVEGCSFIPTLHCLLWERMGRCWQKQQQNHAAKEMAGVKGHEPVASSSVKNG